MVGHPYYSDDGASVPVPQDEQDLMDWVLHGRYLVSIPEHLSVVGINSSTNRYRIQDLVILDSPSGAGASPETVLTESTVQSMEAFLSNVEKNKDPDSANAKCDIVRLWNKAVEGFVVDPLVRTAFIEGVEQSTGLKLSFVSTDEFLKVAKKKNLGSKSSHELVIKGMGKVKSRVMRIGTILPLK
jgi:hypothetical protein